MSNTSSVIKPTAAAPFRRSHPIGFNLEDDDHQNVLYIDSASTGGRNLQFSVLNTSEESVAFSALTGNVGADNYHLELKFRPGTLANEDQIALTGSSDWSFKVEKGDDGTVSLYFLSSSTSEIASGGKLDLTLQNVSADAGGGARGTRVEFKYRNLKYKNAAATERLEGTRIEHLSIINQRGKKNIPLHVGFVGSNTVLNDGATQNELVLRIGNASSDPISLAASGGATPKFILSLDSGDKTSKPWALGTDSEVGGINVQVKFPGDGWQDVTKSGQSSSPQWEIDIPASLNQLDGQNYLQVKLSSIITDHPSGFTNLYVRYENIPGYWDGQFVCAVEKAPLLYKDLGNNRNVGIGTTAPTAQLSLGKWNKGGSGPSGDGAAQLLLSGSHNEGVNQGSDNGTYKLKIEGYNNDDGKVVYPIYCRDENEKVDFWLKNRPSDNDAPTLYFAGNVGIGTTEPKAKLHVEGDYYCSGNVGIGTTNQKAKLHVEGDYYCSGNVGIGTTSPNAKLHVNGDYYGKGHIYLYAYEGDGQSGTAYIQARDKSENTNLDLQFRTKKGNELVEAMRIDSSGNVGIGTTSPNAKLHVEGDLKIKDSFQVGAQGFKVNGSKPMEIKRYTATRDNSSVTTNYNVNQWSAAVVGFEAESTGNDIRGLQLRAEKSGNKWSIWYDTIGETDKQLIIDVLFIKKELVVDYR